MKRSLKETIHLMRVHALPLFWVGMGMACVGLILHVICICSAAAADAINHYIGGVVRMILCYVTVWLPNSVAECFVLLLPVILIFLIVVGVRAADSDRRSWRFLSGLLGFIMILYACFVPCFAAPYTGTDLDEKFGLAQRDVTAQELYETIQWTIEQTNEYAKQVDYLYGGFSVMHDTYDSMSAKIMDAYDVLHETYPFFFQFHSRVKPIIFSEALSYTHLTGVYTFFTGEANINTAFPDYTIPFTAAHELAHQRGAARENEANFMAFMALICSDDPYLQYSAYLNMTEYLANALYEADSELLTQAYANLSMEVQMEMTAYQAFFEKYADSTASKVAQSVNDTYLKASGQKAGTKSYGLVVDLAVAYYYDCVAGA